MAPSRVIGSPPVFRAINAASGSRRDRHPAPGQLVGPCRVQRARLAARLTYWLITLDKVTHGRIQRLLRRADRCGRRSPWASAASSTLYLPVRSYSFGEHKALDRSIGGAGRCHHQRLRQLPPAPPQRAVRAGPASAAELTRFKTPWLLGTIEQFGLKWDEKLTSRRDLALARAESPSSNSWIMTSTSARRLQELLATRGSVQNPSQPRRLPHALSS